MSYSFNILASFETYPDKLFTIVMNHNDIINEKSFIIKIFDNLENHLIYDLSKLSICHFINKNSKLDLEWLDKRNGKYYFSENDDVKFWKRFKSDYTLKLDNNNRYFSYNNYRSKTCTIL